MEQARKQVASQAVQHMQPKVRSTGKRQHLSRTQAHKRAAHLQARAVQRAGGSHGGLEDVGIMRRHVAAVLQQTRGTRRQDDEWLDEDMGAQHGAPNGSEVAGSISRGGRPNP